MGKYDDMINLPRPLSGKPSMPVTDRAKIFQPFAALKGYEELIKEQQKLTVERRFLSEERREELDIMLRKLLRELELGDRPRITVVHFIVDRKVSEESGRELGKYAETTGRIRKIDNQEGTLWLGEQFIAAEDILDIKSNDLFTKQEDTVKIEENMEVRDENEKI